MAILRSILCMVILTLAGCAGLPNVGDDSNLLARPDSPDWIETFPAYSTLPANVRDEWDRTAKKLLQGVSSETQLGESLENNAAGSRAMSQLMTQMVDAAFHGASIPEALDSPEDLQRLIRALDPAFVLRLIGPSFGPGEPLDGALLDEDSELALLFESPDDGGNDPGFGLYLDVIDTVGHNSAVSQALIQRMFFIRPLRAMDLMLERYPAALPDAMRTFGIQQGVRLQIVRQSLGNGSKQDALEWMTRALSPLQGHEVWWVRYYARRILELQVARMQTTGA